jgi:hypothetical protein
LFCSDGLLKFEDRGRLRFRGQNPLKDSESGRKSVAVRLLVGDFVPFFIFFFVHSFCLPAPFHLVPATIRRRRQIKKKVEGGQTTTENPLHSFPHHRQISISKQDGNKATVSSSSLFTFSILTCAPRAKGMAITHRCCFIPCKRLSNKTSSFFCLLIF